MKKVFVLIAMLLITLTAHASYAVQILDDQTGGDCLTIGTWDTVTKTCTLTSDHVITEGIVVRSSNVTLDGNGHQITGSGTGMGVWTSGSNTTIRNLAIDHYYTGITVGRASGFLVENNTTTKTRWAGIYVKHAHNGMLKGNTIISGPNASQGIHIVDSKYNTIDNNTVLEPEYKFYSSSLILHGAAGNIVSNNVIEGYTRISSYFGGGPCCSNIEIFQNTLHKFYIWWSQDNIIYNNNILGQVNAYQSTGTVYNLTPDIGGNYWARFDTPEEGCFDLNTDGYCDSPFHFTDGVDYYPLTKPYNSLPETPEQAAELINDLVSDGLVDANMANPLLAKLETALTAETAGAALGSLGAFINQVNAQRGKKIDDATADELIAIAEALMAQF